jgi:hypothetical protein
MVQGKPVKIWKCNCGYTWFIDNSSPIPENVIGPIFFDKNYWMHKPRLISAYDWYDQYADCAHRYFKEIFGS